MQNDPEALLDTPGQRAGLQIRVVRKLCPHVIGDFRGELARLFGPPLARKKSFDTILPEVLLRLVDRGAGESKIRRRHSDWPAIDLNGPECFVLELNEVVRIKEVTLLKRGMTIEGAARAEGLDFLRVSGHGI